MNRYTPTRGNHRCYVPVALRPFDWCRKCGGKRPRQRGRTLCWYCADPKKRCSREPHPCERRP